MMATLRLARPPGAPAETDALAIRARAGDRRAADELARRTLGLVAWRLSWVSRVAPEVAEDVVARVWGTATVAALATWDPAREPYRLRLLSLAWSSGLDALSAEVCVSRKRLRRDVAGRLEVPVGIPRSHSEPHQLRAVEASELHRAVAQLPLRRRRLMRAELADRETGMTPATKHYHRREALAALAVLLEAP